MKCVKVTITRGNVGEDMMKYPARYNAQEVDRNGLGSCAINQASISYSGAISRGASQAHCIILLSDALANEYAVDPLMEIISKTTADTLMEQWRKDNRVPEETVRDINRITAIQAKQAVNITLTAEDLKALDVNDSVPGVNKSRRTMAEVEAFIGQAITS